MSDPQPPVPPLPPGHAAAPPLPPGHAAAPPVPPIPPGYAAAPPVPPQPYAAPYVAPVHPQAGATLSAPPPARRRTLGLVAMYVGLVAAVVTPVVAGVAAFQIGLGAGKGIAQRPASAPWDWSILTPVRDWVLVGEIAFWSGTVLGVWALVQGVVALVTARGRSAAIVAAALGLVLFGVATWVTLELGMSSGSSIGG